MKSDILQHFSVVESRGMRDIRAPTPKKIVIFSKFLNFFPPKKCIFMPSSLSLSLSKKKNISGATTAIFARVIR